MNLPRCWIRLWKHKYLGVSNHERRADSKAHIQISETESTQNWLSLQPRNGRHECLQGPGHQHNVNPYWRWYDMEWWWGNCLSSLNAFTLQRRQTLHCAGQRKHADIWSAGHIKFTGIGLATRLLQSLQGTLGAFINLTLRNPSSVKVFTAQSFF